MHAVGSKVIQLIRKTNLPRPIKRFKLKIRTRLTSVSLILLLILPYLVFAFDGLPFQEGADKENTHQLSLLHKAEVNIPSNLGQITKHYAGHGNQTVVFIQDIHCQYEVQSHIAGILKRLAQAANLRVVGVEGDSRPVNVSLLSSFPIKQIRENVVIIPSDWKALNPPGFIKMKKGVWKHFLITKVSAFARTCYKPWKN